jgi:beta-phosphoglucomutase-like phosphatase (HAD superfamily)
MARRHIRLFGAVGTRVVTALVFDCDGVLADTERHGHLPAFNATFERVRAARAVERGEDVRREAADRRRQGTDGVAVRRPGLRRGGAGDADRTELLLTWHRAKTGVHSGWSPRAGSRPGRASPGSSTSALEAGWTVAVASTSAEDSVRAVLAHAVGGPAAARIPVFAGDIVPAKKPDPAIYRLTVDRLGLDRADTLVSRTPATGCSPRPAPGCAAW